MKTMNEFESLIVIAVLILGVCAAMDLPPAAPDAGAGRPGNGYAGSGMTQAFDLAQQATSDISGSGAAVEPVSMTSPDAGKGRGHAPILLLRSPPQARTSW